MNSTAPLPKFPLLICLAGIVAAAVPCRVMHRGFWNYGFQGWSSDTHGVRIDEIQPGTPAAAIQPQEHIVAVNGDSEAIYDLHRAWHKAPVGSEVEFAVLHGDPPAVVKVPMERVSDPIAGYI